MNPQDYSKLIDFRSAMINALPADPLSSELEFEDMLTVIEIILKSNEVIDRLSNPVTAKTQMNAVARDSNEVTFREPVAQTFSKEDLLKGYDQTIGIEKQATQITQQAEQPVSRDSYIQPFPPTPQNGSYGNDLRNMNQYQEQANTITPEVIPTPWEVQQYAHQPVQLPSISSYPPEVQMMLRDAMQFGNLQVVMTELGMMPSQYQRQQQ